MSDVTVDLLGMKLQNPTVLPSGILGESMGMLGEAAVKGVGLLITKSITMRPREGYQGPTVIEAVPGGLVNAMGLPNPGVEEFSKTYKPVMNGVPVIPSIYGNSVGELRELSLAIDTLDPPAIEVNLSCPHAGGSSRRKLVAQDPALTAQSIGAVVSTTDVPIIAKLTPNVTDIYEIAAAALFAGASAVSAINTFSALEIDGHFERPVLGNFIGGMSGPAIRPLALAKIAEIALAMKDGRLEEAPIIAYGGAANGEDIAKFLLVGATAVGLGSAVYQRDLDIFAESTAELEKWMSGKGYDDLASFRGKALDWLESDETPEFGEDTTEEPVFERPVRKTPEAEEEEAPESGEEKEEETEEEETEEEED